ncbi:hypothetical protein Cassandra_0154 [Pseudomonas phage Cassandra]|nr:hypothetical protein Cassandra_0154 [Pseudomonas phage Cassandra]
MSVYTYSTIVYTFLTQAHSLLKDNATVKCLITTFCYQTQLTIEYTYFIVW